MFTQIMKSDLSITTLKCRVYLMFLVQEILFGISHLGEIAQPHNDPFDAVGVLEPFMFFYCTLKGKPQVIWVPSI